MFFRKFRLGCLLIRQSRRLQATVKGFRPVIATFPVKGRLFLCSSHRQGWGFSKPFITHSPFVTLRVPPSSRRKAQLKRFFADRGEVFLKRLFLEDDILTYCLVSSKSIHILSARDPSLRRFPSLSPFEQQTCKQVLRRISRGIDSARGWQRAGNIVKF